MHKKSSGSRSINSRIARKYGVYVALPLICGILIYGVFRSDLPPLLMALMDQLSMTHRPIQLGSKFDWFVYNVPDALWAFSFTCFLLIACRNDSSATRKTYLAFGSALMIGVEVAQGSYLPGTYDHLDVLATVAGMGLSYSLLRRLSHQ
jgi:hypothetical protein